MSIERKIKMKKNSQIKEWMKLGYTKKEAREMQKFAKFNIIVNASDDGSTAELSLKMKQTED